MFIESGLTSFELVEFIIIIIFIITAKVYELRKKKIAIDSTENSIIQ